MEYVTLGKSGLRVSRLCFGTLTVGPLQANLPVEEGARVLAHGFERGINFADTAQYYRNYAYLRRAMEYSGKKELVISTKTYAYTRQMAMSAFDEARKALDRDYIDIFMLHEQESIHTLRGHMEALEFLLEMREKGFIRAVGVSMHHIAAVDGVCDINRDIDVIHPIYNLSGLGIADGTKEDMLSAMKRAKKAKIGIFSMKPLGGGHLFTQAGAAFDFVLDNGVVDAVAVGMQTTDEVEANIGYFEKRKFSDKATERLSQRKRGLHIESHCTGCGKCAERCSQKAIIIKNGQAICDKTKCVLCGYCAPVCDSFAIKVL
jgi:aryl-alcohol dehydrogenase-like predicted oxidoreductase